MLQRAEHVAQRLRCGAHLETECALTRTRQHGVGLEQRADAGREAQPLQAGGGEHDRVVLPFVELAQPRVEVAAQRLDLQVGPLRAQLHDAAQARGADARAVRQLVQRRMARGHERIARVLALQHRGQREAVGQVHRHVLQ